ncbi:MAG TPA: hypothetical protein VNU94_06775 [Acidobacteriaceae bacterium]|nr:hypothetical protein [Acidobacteriaceae bacterium]
MEATLHLAPRLLPWMMLPAGLMVFCVFFAAVAKGRQSRSQKATSAVRGFFQQLQDAHGSRYAYAMEQQKREPLLCQQIQPIYFRGRNLAPHKEY